MVPRPKMFVEEADGSAKKYDESIEDEQQDTSLPLEYHSGGEKVHSPLSQPNPQDSVLRPFFSQTSRPRRRRRRHKLHPTKSLPLLVLIDMFAVSLVLPLLFQYFKEAGMTSAKQREFISSLFSFSQIAGGILMGLLTDAGLVQERTLLFISFAGSALSYGLIVFDGRLPALLLSRLIIGLVKQTMTVSTTLLTQCTTAGHARAHHMGRLTAAATVAWIVGPAVGACLFKHIHPRAPPLLACALFVCNLVLAAVWLEPNDDDDDNNDNKNMGRCLQQQQQQQNQNRHCNRNKQPGNRRFSVLANLQSCFTSQALASVVLVRLLLTWVTRATNYSQLGSFYEDMYGLEPHQRGYLSSYQQFLQFVVQSSLVAAVLRWSGGERRAICFATALLVVAAVVESQAQSLWLYLLVICPLTSLCFAIKHLSLQSLLTHVAPSSSILTVLAALDVLQNIVSVSVPFYRAALIRVLAVGAAATADQDDPDPIAWVRSSGLHWCLAAAATTSLLWNTNNNSHGKTAKILIVEDSSRPLEKEQ